MVPHIPPNTAQYRPIPPNTAQYRPIPPNTAQYRPIPPNTAQYRPIPPNTAQYRPIPPNTAKYRQIPPNTAKYRQIPPNTAKYRQIPPNTAKYRQILRIWRYLGSGVGYDNWLTTIRSPVSMTQGGSQDFASRFSCRTISSLGSISIFRWLIKFHFYAQPNSTTAFHPIRCII